MRQPELLPFISSCMAYPFLLKDMEFLFSS